MRAIVTGHSRGLGAAIAAALLARDIPVLGVSRHGNAELAERYPANLHEQVVDLADTSAVTTLLKGQDFANFASGDEPLALINNAGVLSPTGGVGTHGSAAIISAVQVNVTTPLLLSNAVMQAGAAHRERRILHVSSGAARTPYAGWSVYCATKAALDHHARAVALEAHPGLRICSVAPGVIDTGMQAEVRALSPAAFPAHERFVNLKANQQLADPQEAGDRLLNYLLSPFFGREALADVRDLVEAC